MQISKGLNVSEVYHSKQKIPRDGEMSGLMWPSTTGLSTVFVTMLSSRNVKQFILSTKLKIQYTFDITRSLFSK